MNHHRLYALPTNPKTIAESENHRFSRITPQYSLIYTDKEKPDGSTEMKAEDAFRLSKADESWLFSCNLVLIKEEIALQKPEMIRKFSEKVEEVENILTELAKESGEKEEQATKE